MKILSYLLQSFSIGLSLLPAFVDPKERCDCVHPLDEPRACPQGNHSIVLGHIQLCLVPGSRKEFIQLKVCIGLRKSDKIIIC